jgi:hypothetical protein
MTDLKVTTDELRKIVNEEIDTRIEAKITTRLADYPRRAEMETLVDTRVKALIAPIVEEIKNGFTKLDKAMAVLIEQTRHNEETVREVKATQQHQDIEMDTLKQVNSRHGEQLVTLQAESDSIKMDVFGAPDRQGTKSLFDHITDLGRELSAAIGTSAREFTQGLQTLQTNVGTLTARIVAVEVQQTEDRRWIEARRKVERLVIQIVPRASKRLLEACTDKWVQRAGIGAGLSVLAFLLERIG